MTLCTQIGEPQCDCCYKIWHLENELAHAEAVAGRLVEVVCEDADTVAMLLRDFGIVVDQRDSLRAVAPMRGLMVGVSLSLVFWAFVFAWVMTR